MAKKRKINLIPEKVKKEYDTTCHFPLSNFNNIKPIKDKWERTQKNPKTIQEMD